MGSWVVKIALLYCLDQRVMIPTVPPKLLAPTVRVAWVVSPWHPHPRITCALSEVRMDAKQYKPWVGFVVWR